MANAVLKQKFVEKINNQLNDRKKHDELLQKFVHLFFERIHHPNFQKYSIDELVGYVEFVWSCFQTRQQFESQIAFKLISDKDEQNDEWLISLVNNDRPYIIDSLQVLLSKWGISPKLLIHPVMKVRRDSKGTVTGIFSQRQSEEERTAIVSESIILIRVTKNFAPGQLDSFKQQLQQMLKRLILAIDHQPKIEG